MYLNKRRPAPKGLKEDSAQGFNPGSVGSGATRPESRARPRGRGVQFPIAAVLHHSITPRGRIRGRVRSAFCASRIPQALCSPLRKLEVTKLEQLPTLDPERETAYAR
jgi:hypothetical protein